MASPDVLVFHHWHSRSVRIVWLCEELSLNYELDILKDFSEVKSKSYLQKNSNGLLPAVKVANEFYYESGAIMQFLLEKFGKGKLVPASSSPQKGKFLQWLWFLEATFNPPLTEIIHHTKLLPQEQRISEVVPYEYRLARQRMQVVEEQLNKTHYLLGDDFTAADIMCGEVLTIAHELDVLKPDQHPAAYQYLQEMKARTGYQKAVVH